MATLVDCAQWALEETPRYEGAATTAPYQISTDVIYPPVQTLEFQPNPTMMDRSDELRGTEGGPAMLPDTFAPAGPLAMRAYANPLVYLLSVSGMKATYTAGDGVITDPDGGTIPVGADRWVFAKRGGLTAKTMQMLLCYVGAGLFVKGQGVGCQSLTMTAEGAVTADLVGLVWDSVADPNLTPSVQTAAIPPFRRGDLTLTWLGSTATTQTFSFNITNPLVPLADFTLATPSYFPNKMEHGDDKVRLTGSIPKNTIATADLDALLAGTEFSAKAKWLSPKVIGATAYKYTMWLEMPKCQYTGGSVGAMGNTRRKQSTFDFWAAWDESTSKDFAVTIVTALTSITAPGVGL